MAVLQPVLCILPLMSMVILMLLMMVLMIPVKVIVLTVQMAEQQYDVFDDFFHLFLPEHKWHRMDQAKRDALKKESWEQFSSFFCQLCFVNGFNL